MIKVEVLPIEDHQKETRESREELVEELITIPFENDPMKTIQIGTQLTSEYRDWLVIFQRASEDIFA